MIRIIALFAILATSACFPNYSTGSRVGVVTKLSERGLLFKSWEGELLVALPANVAAVAPEKVPFTAGADAVPALQAALLSGKRVELRYRAWFIHPPTVDTSYMVSEVAETE